MIAPSQTADTWHLILQPEGSGQLPEQRARRLLKALSRAYGFRCVALALALVPQLCAACGKAIEKPKRQRRAGVA